MGAEVASTSVVTKLLRVFLLEPWIIVLYYLGIGQSSKAAGVVPARAVTRGQPTRPQGRPPQPPRRRARACPGLRLGSSALRAKTRSSGLQRLRSGSSPRSAPASLRPRWLRLGSIRISSR